MTDLSRAVWRKSTRSGGEGSCVELADLATAVGVRDSKDPSGPALVFDRTELADLLGRVRSGALDL
jgi:hypothetical protein